MLQARKQQLMVRWRWRSVEKSCMCCGTESLEAELLLLPLANLAARLERCTAFWMSPFIKARNDSHAAASADMKEKHASARSAFEGVNASSLHTWSGAAHWNSAAKATARAK